MTAETDRPVGSLIFERTPHYMVFMRRGESFKRFIPHIEIRPGKSDHEFRGAIEYVFGFVGFDTKNVKLVQVNPAETNHYDFHVLRVGAESADEFQCFRMDILDD